MYPSDPGRDTTTTYSKSAALRVEVRRLRAQLAALDARIAALQAANEAAYQAAYDATGGGGFNPLRPAGRKPGADPAIRNAIHLLKTMTGGAA